MSETIKHRQISAELLAEIAAGKYSPGARLPSEAQLVARFGASRPTVARALRDLMAQGLIERRAGSGTFLRDALPVVQPAGARSFGLLIPGLGSTEIFEVICGELASLARAQGAALIWGGSRSPRHDSLTSLEEGAEIVQQFIERKVTGVFFAPFEHAPEQDQANRQMAEQLREEGIPVVLLDRDLGSLARRSEFDLVGIDNFTGGYLLAQHLLKLGCRRLGFVVRPLSASTADLRIAGAREALVRHGLPWPSKFVHLGDPTDLKFVRTLRAEGLDAVICGNDFTAAQLLQTLGRMEIKAPRDLRVVGFDDVRYATLVSVPLTTMHQPVRALAIVALQTMCERLADPALPARSILLAPHLVVRESCGAYLPRKD